MNANELMARAARAAASADLLLGAGDAEGACNRAYYAMFDAARAALLAADAPVPAEIARTHGGLISGFSLHLVKTGRVGIELGRSLNRAAELRLAADYRGEPIESADAAWAVRQAREFVAAVAATFFGEGHPQTDTGQPLRRNPGAGSQ